MNKYFLLIGIALTPFFSYSQKDHICINKKTQQFGSFAKYKKSSSINSKLSRLTIEADTILTVPVVFHILHEADEPIGTGKNISDTQILNQLKILNDDFRRKNADTINTPAIYDGIAADCKIEFKLATVTEDGNPTTGIVRVVTTEKSFNVFDNVNIGDGPEFDFMKSSSTGGSDIWNPFKYLNVWVCAFDDEEPVVGYAQFPYAFYTPQAYPGFEYDGVVIDYRTTEDIGTPSASNLNRTLTHEVGHYFGLFHISGDGDCSKDDYIDDTPTCNSLGLSRYPACSTPGDQCGDGDRMIENFLDDSNDNCLNLFTEGQKEWMREVIRDLRHELVSDPVLTSSKENINPDLSKLISAYPNPATNYFKINLSNEITVERIDLLDNNGVMVDDLKTKTEKIDISSLNQGIYIIKYITNLGTYHEKIVVQ